jgi:hypothetical protein
MMFFSTETPDTEKDNLLKRGRGSQKKTKVLVLAESTPVEENDGKKSKGIGRFLCSVVRSM